MSIAPALGGNSNHERKLESKIRHGPSHGVIHPRIVCCTGVAPRSAQYTAEHLTTAVVVLELDRAIESDACGDDDADPQKGQVKRSALTKQSQAKPSEANLLPHREQATSPGPRWARWHLQQATRYSQ